MAPLSVHSIPPGEGARPGPIATPPERLPLMPVLGVRARGPDDGAHHHEAHGQVYLIPIIGRSWARFDLSRPGPRPKSA
jgi:hypothetical protein